MENCNLKKENKTSTMFWKKVDLILICKRFKIEVWKWLEGDFNE